MPPHTCRPIVVKRRLFFDSYILRCKNARYDGGKGVFQNGPEWLSSMNPKP